MRVFRFTIFVLISSVAFAQDSINSHIFSFSDTLETVQVEDALGPDSELAKHKYLLRASYDFVSEALIAIDSTRTVQQFTVVEKLHSIGPGFGWMFTKNFLVGFEVPIHYIRLDPTYLSNFSLTLNPTAWKLGDINLHAKWRFTPDDCKVNFALMPYVFFPTGDGDYFVSDNSYAFGGKLLMDFTLFRILSLYGNAGYTYANNAEFLNIDRTKRIELAAGGYVKVVGDRIGVNAEVINSITLPGFDEDQNPIAIRLGFRARTGIFRWFFGGALEGLRSARSNDVSLYAGMKTPFGSWEPKKPKAEPEPKVVTVEKRVEVLKKIEILKQSLNIQREINFETNKDVILPMSYPDLDSAAEIMKQYGQYIKIVTIEGHTDTRGNDAYNMDLSQRRANSVKKYLVDKGVPSEKLNAIGYGETKPKVQEIGPETRAMNRRVEFKVSEHIDMGPGETSETQSPIEKTN